MFRRWAAGPIDPELRRRLLALLAAIAHWARQMAGRLPPEVERLLG